MPGDVIRCGETDITYVPSLEEAAFAVVEGASDSIVADSPKADEVDLGLELEPHTEPAAPMEVIVPPMTPPRQEELLASEPLESGLIESSAHDTADVPLCWISTSPHQFNRYRPLHRTTPISPSAAALGDPGIARRIANVRPKAATGGGGIRFANAGNSPSHGNYRRHRTHPRIGAGSPRCRRIRAHRTSRDDRSYRHNLRPQHRRIRRRKPRPDHRGA